MKNLGLKTICFIGSDKSAGKTTAMNLVYKKIKKQNNSPIILSSIGINGESYDSLESIPKPKITIYSQDYFISEAHHLKEHLGKYKILEVFGPPHFKKNYILAKASIKFTPVLEGPNEKNEYIIIKKRLKNFFSSITLLLDGSIDRQFIASPEISDEFYFSLLISNRPEQLKKMYNLLLPLKLLVAQKDVISLINKTTSNNEKSLLLTKKGEILYQSTKVPFLDLKLIECIKNNKNIELILYLNGALSKSLTEMLFPYTNLLIVIDNFTLFLDTPHILKKSPLKNIYLKNGITLKGIFFKQTNINNDQITIDIPKEIPVHNIFKEGNYEFRI